MGAPVIRHLPDIGITVISRWIFNCYLIHDGGDGRPFVVDIGLPSQLDLVAAELRRHGSDLADLGAAVATHGHLDHVAGLPAVRAATEADVLLPSSLRTVLGQDVRRSPGPKQIAEILPVLADQPRDLSALRELQPLQGTIGYDSSFADLPFEPTAWLDDGDHLPGRPDWEIIHAPGHTDDATCLYHRPTRTLVSGDSVLSFDGRAWFNPEYVDASRSAETDARLRLLDVDHVLPGHGRVVTGSALTANALGCDDRPAGGSKLAAVWHLLTNHAARHGHP